MSLGVFRSEALSMCDMSMIDYGEFQAVARGFDKN